MFSYIVIRLHSVELSKHCGKKLINLSSFTCLEVFSQIVEKRELIISFFLLIKHFRFLFIWNLKIY